MRWRLWKGREIIDQGSVIMGIKMAGRTMLSICVLVLAIGAALTSSTSSSSAIIHEISGATCHNPTGRVPEPPGQFRNFANALIKTRVVESIVVVGNVTTVTFDTSRPAFKGDPNAPTETITFPNGDQLVFVPGFACPP